jgi:alpha,alpha-trehalase
VVVNDLAELTIGDDLSIREAMLSPATTTPLPNALSCLDDMIGMAGRRPIVVFLDYDGTLTPIVARPEDAHLPESMRTVLQNLAHPCRVASVSGRALADVRERLDLDALSYAGSPGFEIAGPNGFHVVYDPARSFLEVLDRAESALHERLDRLPGVQVERKHFAIAVHVRRAREADVPTVLSTVNAMHQQHTGLRQTEGKKVFELRPDLDWNKGTALFWLLEAMGVEREAVLPLYIGDDMTDEDAFMSLRDIGVGIVVTEAGAPRATAARYALANTEAVRAFLTALAETRKRSHT